MRLPGGLEGASGVLVRESSRRAVDDAVGPNASISQIRQVPNSPASTQVFLYDLGAACALFPPFAQPCFLTLL